MLERKTSGALHDDDASLLTTDGVAPGGPSPHDAASPPTTAGGPRKYGLQGLIAWLKRAGEKTASQHER
jgi:hypothetical protein